MIMLYPKVKYIKRKKVISNIIYDIRSIILDSIKIFQNGKYIMLFMKKNFHF